MRLHFKSAIFSAIVVAILTAVLLGVRLTQVGSQLTVVVADNAVFWKIAAAAGFIFSTTCCVTGLTAPRRPSPDLKA